MKITVDELSGSAPLSQVLTYLMDQPKFGPSDPTVWQLVYLPSDLRPTA
jgi:hypothetical protein